MMENEKTLNQRLIDAIFNLNEAIRYAEVFGPRAERLAGGMRPGVESLDPPNVAAKVDVETAKFGLLLKQNEHYYGRLHYVYAAMERINVMILPLGEKVLVVATNPPAGIEILSELKEVLEAFSQSLK